MVHCLSATINMFFDILVAHSLLCATINMFFDITTPLPVFQISIQGTVGDHFYGDIAIDDISFTAAVNGKYT